MYNVRMGKRNKNEIKQKRKENNEKVSRQEPTKEKVAGPK